MGIFPKLNPQNLSTLLQGGIKWADVLQQNQNLHVLVCLPVIWTSDLYSCMSGWFEYLLNNIALNASVVLVLTLSYINWARCPFHLIAQQRKTVQLLLSVLRAAVSCSGSVSSSASIATSALIATKCCKCLIATKCCKCLIATKCYKCYRPCYELQSLAVAVLVQVL